MGGSYDGLLADSPNRAHSRLAEGPNWHSLLADGLKGLCSVLRLRLADGGVTEPPVPQDLAGIGCCGLCIGAAGSYLTRAIPVVNMSGACLEHAGSAWTGACPVRSATPGLLCTEAAGWASRAAPP